MPQVTIYTTPTCIYCLMTKKFFQDNKIDYTELDVRADRQAGMEMVEKSNQTSTPVIAIESGGQEHIIVGFQRRK